MTRRLRDIVLLLGSLTDYDYAPPTWTGQLVARAADKAGHGESPSKRQACPHCSGDGTVLARAFRNGPLERVPCPRCQHRRWIEVDDYTGREIGSVLSGKTTIALKTVPCDSCWPLGWTKPHGSGSVRGEVCPRCGGSGYREVTASAWFAVRTTLSDAVEQSFGDPLLSAMEHRSRVGSYDELGRALEELHRAWAALYRIVLEVYWKQESVEQRIERYAGWGLQFIEARMPDPIVVPKAVRIADRHRVAAERIERRKSREQAA